MLYLSIHKEQVMMEAMESIFQKIEPSGTVSDSSQTQVVADYGAALGITLAYMGDKLGLFRAMAYKGAVSAEEVALACFLNEPLVREWLVNVAAEGYVVYDPETDSFELPDENALALTDRSSLMYVSGGFSVVEGMKQADQQIREEFLKGRGAGMNGHYHKLFNGTERFFKQSYADDLLLKWLPSIPGLIEKLDAGIKVADIGCSHGAATIVLAREFPNSNFTGFEPHYYSVDRGNMMAKDKRVRNVHFVTAAAEAFEGEQYDLITFFNCLHEVVDPLATFRHCYDVLKPEGSIMVSESLAGYITEASFNPLKRMFKGASVLHCLLDGTGDKAIEELDGRDELEKMANQAGFTHYRRTIDTEFNRVLEIRR